MTTITREFTKEQLIAKAQEQIEFIRRAQVTGAGREHVDMCAALFEIALSSLTAEPIGAFHISDQQVGGTSDYIKDGEWPIDNGIIEVYAAPPAPGELAKAFISAIEKEQDRLFGEDYLMDSKGCVDVIREEAQRLNACRAAMLQERRKADLELKKYNIGNLTMRHVFDPAGITDVSDLQAVFEQVETALSSLERGQVVWVGFDLAKDEVSALQGNQAPVKQLSSDCPKCGGYGTYHCPQMLGTVECECTLPAIPQQEAE
ncbi:hypothetical protein [Citrobacter sedlakii]|uniref:hypothetical protein n=1 Tax=Citrobacter sedlakii TaxID=67826 RepID=UPI00333752FB